MTPEQANKLMAQRKLELQNKQQLDRLTSIEKSLVASMRQLVQFLDGKTTKTEVVNQLKSIATPDVDKVVKALEKLDSSVTGSQLDIKPLQDGLSALEQQLKLIPKELPEQQKLDISKENFEAIEKAIKQLKLDPVIKVNQPKIDVKAPDVHVDAPDLKPLQESLLDVVKAVQAVKLPETDVSKVEKHLEEANKKLQKIVDKPVGGGGGGGGTSYQNTDGNLVYVELTPSGAVPVSSTQTTYKLLLDDTSTTNVTYVGKAAIGSATSASVWQIQKIDETTGMVITWGGTGAFDQVWNNRATTVSYS